MSDYIPHSIVARSWVGLARQCPKCNTSFVSIGDRGQCRNCGHVFNASDIYGMHPDTTLEKELTISEEESRRILALELEPLNAIPSHVYEWGGSREDMQERQFFLSRFQAAIKDGAKLFQFVDRQPAFRRGWLVAVKHQRVVATLESELFMQ